MRTIAMLWVACCLSLFGSSVAAQPTFTVAELCRDAEQRVENLLKEMASEQVDGLLDDSAIRQSNRELRRLRAATMIQVQQTHMNTLKCSPLKQPISETFYVGMALACKMATGDERKKLCEQKDWVRKEPKQE